MSHIHLPDGILPVWLWLSGIIIIILYLIGMGIYFKKNLSAKKLPLVGVFAALMLIAMSIEVAPIGYHINLAALSGIILGPVFSVLSIIIVTFLLALVGHGGITVIGLNTIAISVEAILGFFLFRFLKKKSANIFLNTVISTVIALIISTSVTSGILYFGTNSLNEMIHHHHKTEQTAIKGHTESEHHEMASHKDFQDEHNTHDEENEPFSFQKFLYLVFGLGSVGWILEALITAFIVNYINKIKPDLLENTR